MHLKTDLRQLTPSRPASGETPSRQGFSTDYNRLENLCNVLCNDFRLQAKSARLRYSRPLQAHAFSR